jgi:hypothetical protein
MPRKKGRPKIRNETTSSSVAKKAARLLRESKKKNVKSVAASALTQKKNTKKGVKNMPAKRKTATKARRRTTAKKTVARNPGNPRKNNPGPMIKTAQTAVLALAGGIASGFIANQIPVEDTRIKAAIPIGGGLMLAAFAGTKNHMAMGFALGMMVLGGVSLVKQLAPQLPMLAGEQYMAMPYPQYDKYMGKTVAFAGETKQFAGESDYQNMAYTSPVNI